MKKIYNLLALVMLFTFAGSAQAIYWEKTGGDPTTVPVEGTAYFIMPGNADYYADNAYLSSTGEITTTLATSEQNVWYFEAAATEGRWKVYCLINGEKHYLAKAENASQGFVTTTNSRINEVLVAEATYAADATEATEMELDYFTTKEGADPSVEVLLVGSPNTYLYKNGAKGGWSSSADGNNTWCLLPAQEMSGTNYLDAVINEMFPDGFDPDAYSVGINPGDYSEEALNALVEAYENANAGSGDDNECIELANALRAAYEAMVASFVDFGEGYYIFTTLRSSVGAMFDNTNNVAGAKNNMYTTTDPAIAITHTQNGTEFSIGDWDVYDPENDEVWMAHAAAPYFIWKVIKSDKEGMFYIQNWKTGRYIGTPGADKLSSTPIPTVEEPNAAFNMAPSTYRNDAGETCWTFYSEELTKKSAWGGGWDMGGLHAPGDVLNMVTWDATTEGSCWYPRAVTEDMLAQITELNQQATLNFNLKSLVSEVEAAIENAKIYSIFDTATGKPAEGLNVVESLLTEEGIADGLVYDIAQLYTNAQETSEGPIESLVDGDLDTFFHSAWNSDGAPQTIIVVDPETEEEVEAYPPHYITFDLLEQPQEAVTVVWYTRTGKPADRPVGVKVYASNDETEESEIDGIYKEWTEIGENEFYYDLNNKVDLDGSTHNNYVGILAAKLGAKYRYVRVDVLTTGGNSGNYGKFFNGAEVRVYGGIKYEYKYDEENSPYEGVPAAIKDALNEKLDLAKTELEDELATQPTIDALQAAYDNYMNNLPDPTTVQNLVKEALAQADAAEEGDGVGYFAVGAADELRSVAESINVTGTSSVEEILAALNKIKAAIAAFNGKLNKPVNGKYYYIKSATSAGEDWFNSLSEEEQLDENNENKKVTQYADNDFIGTRNAEGYNVAWGAEELTDDIEDYLGYVWQSETNADGTFSLKHVLTGYYMGGDYENNANVELVPADQKGKFDYQSAKVAGVVNLVFAEGIYLNAQPKSNNVVTWGSASGNDNSAIAFEEAEAIAEGGDYIIDLSSSEGLRVMTLPVAVSIPNYTIAYEVLGLKGEGETATIELKTLTGAIAAGTPFIFNPDGFAEAAFEGVKFGAASEALNANGLQGVFVTTPLPGDGYLVLSGETAVLADKGQNVGAGRGFFTKEMKATTETGDLSLACPDGAPSATITAIESIITRAASKASFDLQGRRVQNTVKGLYIINGQKVLVK